MDYLGYDIEDQAGSILSESSSSGIKSKISSFLGGGIVKKGIKVLIAVVIGKVLWSSLKRYFTKAQVDYISERVGSELEQHIVSATSNDPDRVRVRHDKRNKKHSAVLNFKMDYRGISRSILNDLDDVEDIKDKIDDSEFSDILKEAVIRVANESGFKGFILSHVLHHHEDLLIKRINRVHKSEVSSRRDKGVVNSFNNLKKHVSDIKVVGDRDLLNVALSFSYHKDDMNESKLYREENMREVRVDESVMGENKEVARAARGRLDESFFDNLKSWKGVLGVTAAAAFIEGTKRLFKGVMRRRKTKRIMREAGKELENYISDIIKSRPKRNHVEALESAAFGDTKEVAALQLYFDFDYDELIERVVDSIENEDGIDDEIHMKTLKGTVRSIISELHDTDQFRKTVYNTTIDAHKRTITDLVEGYIETNEKTWNELKDQHGLPEVNFRSFEDMQKSSMNETFVSVDSGGELWVTIIFDYFSFEEETVSESYRRENDIIDVGRADNLGSLDIIEESLSGGQGYDIVKRTAIDQLSSELKTNLKNGIKYFPMLVDSENITDEDYTTAAEGVVNSIEKSIMNNIRIKNESTSRQGVNVHISSKPNKRRIVAEVAAALDAEMTREFKQMVEDAVFDALYEIDEEEFDDALLMVMMMGHEDEVEGKVRPMVEEWIIDNLDDPSNWQINDDAEIRRKSRGDSTVKYLAYKDWSKALNTAYINSSDLSLPVFTFNVVFKLNDPTIRESNDPLIESLKHGGDPLLETLKG